VCVQQPVPYQDAGGVVGAGSLGAWGVAFDCVAVGGDQLLSVQCPYPPDGAAGDGGELSCDVPESPVCRLPHRYLRLVMLTRGRPDAAGVNTLAPGDSVLAVTPRACAERFAEIAEASGADDRRMAFEWHAPPEPDRVRAALAERPTRALLLTHNETSTGVLNDL